MNPDQEEKWKAAVMPVALGVIAGFEVSAQGKEEARKRLNELGVPIWAIQLREHLLERIAIGHLPFLPTFAIRVEVALSGIGCLHPLPNDRLAVHQLVLVRFFELLLAPLAQRVEASADSELHREYQTLLGLYRILRSDASPHDLKPWSAALGKLERQVQLHYPRTRADYLPFWGIQIIQAGTGRPYDELDTGILNRFLFQLGKEYEIHYQDEGSQIERIAHLFLAALETQCPEPNWLPRY